jgi:hypothetical protein
MRSKAELFLTFAAGPQTKQAVRLGGARGSPR